MTSLISRVALVESNSDIQGSLKRGLKLIGKDALNTTERSVVVKPGIFNHKKKNHPTVSVVSAIIESFNKAPQIFIAESDNYKGIGSERLQIYKKLFTERVVPFNLSEDINTREVNIADEKMGFSHILFKPNILVSTHVLRRFEKGTILKNLLGLIPEGKKARLHKKLVTVLLDTFEATGGVDLAVIDGTYAYLGATSDKGIKTNVLLVGRDAVAVEAVGATLVGLDPEKMPVIQEAMKRGLGEGDMETIEVLGDSFESVKENVRQLLRSLKKTS